jgi:hypothetical protein
MNEKSLDTVNIDMQHFFKGFSQPRSIDELINSVKSKTYLSDNDLEYQQLIELKKRREDWLLSQEDVSQELPNWDYIENTAWQIILNKGVDLKLLALWVETFIYTYHITNLAWILHAILQILINCPKILSDDKEQTLVSIKYLDKKLAKAIITLNLNISMQNEITLTQFEQFQLGKSNEFHDKCLSINSCDYEKLLLVHEEICKTFNQLSEFVINNKKTKLIKTQTAICSIKNFDLYLTDIKTNNEQIQQNSIPIQRSVHNKEEAFEHLLKCIEILENIDSDTLVLALLYKAMQWSNFNTLEILDDLGSAQQIEIFMKMLKNKNT